MPATPDRIGFIRQAFRVVKSGPDSGVVARYGDSARDTPDPLPSFFDSEDDAQILSDERLALLSPDRRRLAMITVGAPALPSAMPIDPVLPTVTMIDAERGIDTAAVVTEISIDTERDRSTLVPWG
jgi:hypothetical protein